MLYTSSGYMSIHLQDDLYLLPVDLDPVALVGSGAHRRNGDFPPGVQAESLFDVSLDFASVGVEVFLAQVQDSLVTNGVEVSVAVEVSL